MGEGVLGGDCWGGGGGGGGGEGDGEGLVDSSIRGVRRPSVVVKGCCWVSSMMIVLSGCGVMWCGVMWCGVMWWGVSGCGVIWCGVGWLKCGDGNRSGEVWRCGCCEGSEECRKGRVEGSVMTS